MENKIYQTIKNAILLCLLFLGIQLGLGFVIGLFQIIFRLSDVSLLAGVLTALASIISFGIVLLIGFRKTQRKCSAVFKFNRVSAFLWIAVIIFMIGFVMVTSEMDNLLQYVLPAPAMFRNVFETLMAEQTFIIAIIAVGIVPAFINVVYTITVRYRELIPIKGFNSNFAAPADFQPLWFDLSGLIIVIIGTIMLIKGVKKAKISA